MVDGPPPFYIIVRGKSKSFTFSSVSILQLLVPDRIHRVGTSGLDGLDTHRSERDREGEDSGKEEYSPADFDPVGEAREPPIHCEVCDPPGDQFGDGHEDEKFLRQEPNDTHDRYTECFADPDLLRHLLRGVGAHPEETEASCKNRKCTEVKPEFSEPVYSPLFTVEILLQENTVKGTIGDQLMPFLLQAFERFRDMLFTITIDTSIFVTFHLLKLSMLFDGQDRNRSSLAEACFIERFE